ncbi:hypothetical protein M758_3G158700 [Ceratodon purpureus]|nr:hypothetical protein M758_3G158700 [Ceratodon purpureus]
MGDADVGAGGGASSLDSGDAGSLAASRALMEGGSLPPRKRLLAGLKQNGWLSTSPPPVVSPTPGGYASGVDTQTGGVSVVVGGSVRSGSGKYEDGCMGCNAVESNGLRRIKRGGVSLRLCSACTLLYSKSMFCPHCLAMYHDASLLGDPSMWLVCSRCRRSVHPECEQKHSGSTPDPASYVCLDCANSARRQREANGVTGMRSKHSSARPVPNFHGESRAGASAGLGGDFVSPALKKPRMSRERSSRPGDHERADGPRLERHRSGPDVSGGTGVARGGSLVPSKKSSLQPQSDSASPQEAAVAARNAATAAAKVAAAAKANAAAKAAASVRAAAVAKAALEAAAHASRADAAARAELRRKMASGENRVGGGGGPMRLEINVHSEHRRERSSKGEMKYERDDGYVPRRTGPGSVADEELARQLHRVINSSPRISRSMTPMRRKASVKPDTPSSGVSNSSAETVRVRPRTSPAEPAQEQAQVQHEHEQQHHHFKHQQTRPRSITHKEFRRIDSRVSRHEVKLAEDGSGQGGERVGVLGSSGQGASLNDGGGHSAEDLASGVKSEAMDGAMFAPVGVHDDASILFEALVEGEGMHAAGEGGEGGGRRPDYLQEILEAAVLTDTAMFNDGAHEVVSVMETVRSETEIAEQGHDTLVMSGLDGEADEGVAKDGKEYEGEGVAAEAVTLVHDEENGSTVVHESQVKVVGDGDAPPVDEEDPTPGPVSMSETRSEERPSGEPAEVIMTEADAVEVTVTGADASKETISEPDTSIETMHDAIASEVTVAVAGTSEVAMGNADASMESKSEVVANLASTSVSEVRVLSTGSEEGKSGGCESGEQAAPVVATMGSGTEQSG